MKDFIGSLIESIRKYLNKRSFIMALDGEARGDYRDFREEDLEREREKFREGFKAHREGLKSMAIEDLKSGENMAYGFLGDLLKGDRSLEDCREQLVFLNYFFKEDLELEDNFIIYMEGQEGDLDRLIDERIENKAYIELDGPRQAFLSPKDLAERRVLKLYADKGLKALYARDFLDCDLILGPGLKLELLKAAYYSDGKKIYECKIFN